MNSVMQPLERRTHVCRDACRKRLKHKDLSGSRFSAVTIRQLFLRRAFKWNHPEICGRSEYKHLKVHLQFPAFTQREHALISAKIIFQFIMKPPSQFLQSPYLASFSIWNCFWSFTFVSGWVSHVQIFWNSTWMDTFTHIGSQPPTYGFSPFPGNAACCITDASEKWRVERVGLNAKKKKKKKCEPNCTDG